STTGARRLRHAGSRDGCAMTLAAWVAALTRGLRPLRSERTARRIARAADALQAARPRPPGHRQRTRGRLPSTPITSLLQTPPRPTCRGGEARPHDTQPRGGCPGGSWSATVPRSPAHSLQWSSRARAGQSCQSALAIGMGAVSFDTAAGERQPLPDSCADVAGAGGRLMQAQVRTLFDGAMFQIVDWRCTGHGPEPYGPEEWSDAHEVVVVRRGVFVRRSAG